MYNYELKNGHCVVDADGRSWFLDTGSHKTFAFDGSKGKILIGGIEHDLGSNPGYNQDIVEKVIGTKIYGIIGSDFLTKSSFTIYSYGKIDFKVGSLDSKPIEYYGDMNKIIGNITIEGKEVKALFDTGAYINYQKSNILNGFDLKLQITDYDRDRNVIISNGYTYNAKIGNIECNLGFGIPTNNYCSPMLCMLGLNTQAIVGLYNFYTKKPLFNEYFAIDYSSKKIYVK